MQLKCNYSYTTLYNTTLIKLQYIMATNTNATTATLHYTTLHYTNYITLHYGCNCSYTTLITLHYNYNLQLTTTTPLHYNYTYNYNCTTQHYIQQLWWGDHCNHCNHSRKDNSNHLSVHQWIRSTIRESQQPTLPIGFLFLLFLKLPRYYW